MMRKTMKVELNNNAEIMPIAVFVQIANQYDSKVFVEVENKKVNAKSIMGMMSLGLNNGENLTINTEGADESDAIAHIEKFLSGKGA